VPAVRLECAASFDLDLALPFIRDGVVLPSPHGRLGQAKRLSRRTLGTEVLY
jgi:hypothetical protein